MVKRTRFYFGKGEDLQSKPFQQQGETNRVNSRNTSRGWLQRWRCSGNTLTPQDFIFFPVNASMRKNKAQMLTQCLSSTCQSSFERPKCCLGPGKRLFLPQGAQSDFSFSFMCRKTMLNKKSPTIMEKAPA